MSVQRATDDDSFRNGTETAESAESAEFNVDVITINRTHVVIRARGTLTRCTLGLLEALVERHTKAEDSVRVDLTDVTVRTSDLDTEFIGFERALRMRGIALRGPATPSVADKHAGDEELALVC
jgi:anti-anti-sigma regulatory factor